MWSIQPEIPLLRYLIALRINNSWVRLPESNALALEFSQGIGEQLLNLLPLHERRPWERILLPKNDPAFLAMPQPDEMRWHVDTIFHLYPHSKRHGFGDYLFMEVKLLGERASHEFFITYLLPAFEVLGSKRQRSDRYVLWGHYDISHIWVAHGRTWQPIVEDSKLNLKLRPTTAQWAQNLPTRPTDLPTYSQIIWHTAYKFEQIQIPMLNDLLNQLLERLVNLLPNVENINQLWQKLTVEEQTDLLFALRESEKIRLTHHKITRDRKTQICSGWQQFETIPAALLPYLELAAILHLGKDTHYGLGTFHLTKK
ncbi:MAG: hypothetical protein OHK0052_01620 [Anaerolineales bacterium]